jgi:hypothetical protein
MPKNFLTEAIMPRDLRVRRPPCFKAFATAFLPRAAAAAARSASAAAVLAAVLLKRALTVECCGIYTYTAENNPH